MSNAEVIETLRGLLGRVSTEKSGHNRSLLNAVHDAAATEIRPTSEEVGGAAAAWERAASRWSTTRSQVAGIARGLPHDWTGTAASACQNALTGYSTAAATPERGAGDVAGSLLRLDRALADPRADLVSARESLLDLAFATDADLVTALPAVLKQMIGAYTAADAAASRAAVWIHDAAQDLAFPTRAMSQRVSPFLRAVAPAAAATPKRRATRPKAASSTRSTVRRKPVTRSGRATGTRRSAARTPVRRPAGTSPAVNRSVRRPGITTPSRRRVVAPSHRAVTHRANAVGVKASPVRGNVSGKRAQVIAIARQYQGIPYVWGGTTPRGFDCSGLTQYVYRQVGVNLPRLAEAQRFAGRTVPHSQARPGDLVSMAHHVGIYVGNGMMLNAPHTGAVVRTQRIWTNNYTVVRVLP